MPRPRTNNKSVYPLLTEADIALLDREKVRRGAPSLSAVLEAALIDLLLTVDFEEEGLNLPAAVTERLARCYKIAPETARRLDEAAARFGYTTQDIMRAAIGQLGKTALPAPGKRERRPLPLQDPAPSGR